MSNNSIVLAAEVNKALGKELFNDIDFQALDTAIEKIGGLSQKLTDAEKSMAMDIVDTWNEKVIERLHDRFSELQNLLAFLTVPQDEHGIFDYTEYVDLEQLLASKTATTELYVDLVNARAELKTHKQQVPLEPTVDETTEVFENIDEASEYGAAYRKFNLKAKKLNRNVLIAERKWKLALLSNPYVSDIVEASKRQIKNVKNMTTYSSEKASVAKINVAIDNQDVRDNLKAMFEFSKQI